MCFQTWKSSEVWIYEESCDQFIQTSIVKQICMLFTANFAGSTLIRENTSLKKAGFWDILRSLKLSKEVIPFHILTVHLTGNMSFQ